MEIEMARRRVQSRPAAREIALAVIGPLTALAGVVWAVAQPYRLTMVNDARDEWWDHLAQPPLLVLAVGVFFTLAVAGPLARALRGET